jgi:signal transduction histidine kinase
MRRLIPDSLAAWGLLTLIVGLVVMQVFTLVIMADSRAENARMLGFFHLAERVSSISRALAAEEPSRRTALANVLSDPTLNVAVEREASARDPIAGDSELAELEDILQGQLEASGIADVHVERRDVAEAEDAIERQLDDDTGPLSRVLSDIEAQTGANGSYVASVLLSDGSWVNFRIAIAPPTPIWSTDTILFAGVAIALVLAASIWWLRHLIAPYGFLARAAERFGQDLNTPPLPEEGPREVRAASRAFNRMQSRLRRVIEDRDQLAAAMSHDLRTPVTRLRLRAEYVGDRDQRARMLSDLDEIEVITRSVLAFASDTARPEQREPVDLISLLETLCDDTPGAHLHLPDGMPARLAFKAQPVALRRCIANLIDNAIKYGGQADVSLRVDPAALHVMVEDRGPGIPVEEFENVFRPFRRLESSRNRETGGTGLGLTIARTIARAHGGEVVIANRPEGGLHVELSLPVAVTAERVGLAA